MRTPWTGPDPKHRKPWSDADDEVLRASIAGGNGLLETASLLCRSGTPFEVYKRARELGLRWHEDRKRRAKAAEPSADDTLPDTSGR
jgi:hypothetical protein